MNSSGYHEVHIFSPGDDPRLETLHRALPELALKLDCDPLNTPRGSICHEYPMGRETEFERAARNVGLHFEWGGGAASRFQVYRIKGDNTLVLVGSVNTTETVKRMCRQGAYFYGVAAEGASQNLTIINAVKSDAPEQVSVTNVGTVANGVAVQGRLAFVFGPDVKIVDVTAPAVPFVRGTLVAASTENYIGGDVAGDYLYAAESDAGALVVIDISDPTAPSIVGTLALGFTPTAVKLYAGVAHVAGSNGEIALVNVDAPASPSLIASVTSTGQGWEFIGVWGGIIFLTGQSATGLEVWSQAETEGDPPTLIEGFQDTPINHTSQLDVSGRRAYFASGGTLYSYRIGGFYCHAIATGSLKADELKAEKVEARHGYFKGALVASELTVFGASFETETGALFVANFIQLGSKRIYWSDSIANPNATISASLSSIFMANDGTVWRNTSGTDVWVAM
jgi:hypothetical protein